MITYSFSSRKKMNKKEVMIKSKIISLKIKINLIARL